MAPSYHTFPIERQRAVATQLQSTIAVNVNAWDHAIFHGLKFVQAHADGRFVWEIQVTPTMVNPGGTIHGGCLGTIIDVASTIAKLLIDVSQDREPLPGVSLSLGVTFVSAAKPGETLFVEVTVPKVGRQVFFTNTQLFAKEKDGSKGRLVAEGPHTKFVPPPPPAPKKSKI